MVFRSFFSKVVYTAGTFVSMLVLWTNVQFKMCWHVLAQQSVMFVLLAWRVSRCVKVERGHWGGGAFTKSLYEGGHAIKNIF